MSNTLLAIEDYSGGFRGETGELAPVLHGVSYRLKTGVMTAVVGESGSGKSLVALSILGIQPPAFERRNRDAGDTLARVEGDRAVPEVPDRVRVL